MERWEIGAIGNLGSVFKEKGDIKMPRRIISRR